MAPSPDTMRLLQRRTLALLAISAALVSGALPHTSPAASVKWVWPVVSARIVASYQAPAHAYGPGHRGIDIIAPAGSAVTSPAGGVVAFAGLVAGRPLMTIDHGSGLVTTLEPVSATVRAGTTVTSGEIVGEVAEGGHAAPGSIHFGVRDHGEYINPLLLLGDIPRAVLLPLS